MVQQVVFLAEINRDVLRVRRRFNQVVQIGGWIFTSIHSRHGLIIVVSTNTYV